MNVLAIVAHPDDCVMMCGGTLARYAQGGHNVVMAVFCQGASCMPSLPAEQAAQIRGQETRAGAQLIGADLVIFGRADGGVATDETARRWVVEVIRRTSPDVILSHHPSDYIPDHRRAAELVDDCAIEATCPHIVTESPPCSQLSLVFYMETVSGLGFVPEEFVDITDTFETKRRMLACHESDIGSWRDHPVVDMMEWIEVVARFRGIQAGVRYAEAFCRAPIWGRMETRRLLP